MLQALLAGVASMKAQQTRMNVIGNNLANVNTTAFKGSRVTFEDMISQTIQGASSPTTNLGGTNPIQIGLGVLVAGTDVNSEQGSLNATNRPTDLALQGGGFFMVSNGQRVVYTRDGSFDLDANGDLVHRTTGERLLGWAADPVTGAINIGAQVDPASTLRVPIGASAAAQATSQISWTGNLNAADPVVAAPLPAYPDPAYRTATVRAFDTLGAPHELTLAFIKTGANTWGWQVVGPTGGATVAGTGSLVFDGTTGRVSSGSPGSITVTPPAGGAPAFTASLDFSTMSQFASASVFQASNQNGFAPGTLQGFSVNADGVVTGLYTNGMVRAIGQVALAEFANANGLERSGNNMWRETANSGGPVVGVARNGARGTISAGFLEQSNVDIGSEFTDLIITQRGFQANTRVVTTVDEMLQDLLNMKR